jgi:hypothetical protein
LIKLVSSPPGDALTPEIWHQILGTIRCIAVVKKRSVKGPFFLQPLIPTFGISELIFEKRYKKLSL